MNSQITMIDKNLSSVLKHSKLSMETSKSSFASSHKNSSKKSSSKSSFSLIEFNYVNNQENLRKEANALIKKPLKNSNIKSDKLKNNLIDLNDYDDPFINVKLNVNKINPVLDDNEEEEEEVEKKEEINVENSLQKQITRKMFSNIIKDYDMVGIAPVLDSNLKLTHQNLSSSEETLNNNENVFHNYDEDDDEDDDSLHGNKKNVNFEQYSPNTKGKIK